MKHDFLLRRVSHSGCVGMISAILVLALCHSAWGVAFSYRLIGTGEAELTKCPTSTKGAVDIPASIDGYKVVSLGPDAFSGCKKITSITVPSSVEVIDDRCFKKCSGLKKFAFADGRTKTLYVGNNVFESAKLKTLVLPSKTMLQSDAFFDSKITSLEVTDSDPSTYLFNIDDVLSPYTGSGSKLKLRSDIKKLIVPRGSLGTYMGGWLEQFLFGRKKKNRGTVVEQYPRVYVDKTPTGSGASYFKLNGKKLANGAPVKPGTKSLQFVSVGAADYAPANVAYEVDGVFKKEYKQTNTFKITMPNGDVNAYGSFVTKNDEKTAIAMVAAFAMINTQSGSLNTPFSYTYVYSDQLKTKTTFTYSGLPKGLKHVTDGTTNQHGITGTPKAAVDPNTAPIFVTIKGASGHSVTLPLPFTFGSLAGLAFTPSAALPQFYNTISHTLSVLGGVNYSSAKAPVSFNIDSGWKISAAKKTLPPGIKLVKTSKTTAVLAGRPTKPGTYVVEVVLTKGKQKKTARLAYTVYAHPLKGSYRGYVNTPAVGAGAMTMTVDSVGKATVAFTEKSTKTTIKNVYPALRSGTTWDYAKPLVGEFTYTFKVPKDKKRKIAARTLKLAYASDASSGVTDAAHVENGPMSAFSLLTNDGSAKGSTDQVRCYPQYTGAAAGAHQLKSSSYWREGASFFATQAGPGGNAAYTTGAAAWATALYDWAKATVTVKGRLPLGKQISTSLPMVCPHFRAENWTKRSDAYYYRDIVVAPLVVADADGTYYLVALTADPSEINRTNASLDRTGFFWLDAGLFSRFNGQTSYHSDKNGSYTTPVLCLSGATQPKLRMAFDFCPWTSADSYTTLVKPAAGQITIYSIANSYQFDPKTGLWSIPFSIEGVSYLFEGVPISAHTGFYGTIRGTYNKKSYFWGAARIVSE